MNKACNVSRALRLSSEAPSRELTTEAHVKPLQVHHVSYSQCHDNGPPGVSPAGMSDDMKRQASSRRETPPTHDASIRLIDDSRTFTDPSGIHPAVAIIHTIDVP